MKSSAHEKVLLVLDQYIVQNAYENVNKYILALLQQQTTLVRCYCLLQPNGNISGPHVYPALGGRH